MANEPKRRGRPKKVNTNPQAVAKALKPVVAKISTNTLEQCKLADDSVRIAPWIQLIETFCNKEGITPEELIEVYKKKKPSIKDILNEKVSTASDYMTQRRRAKGLIL